MGSAQAYLGGGHIWRWVLAQELKLGTGHMVAAVTAHARLLAGRGKLLGGKGTQDCGAASRTTQDPLWGQREVEGRHCCFSCD
jgi:hypothetical protein